MSESENQNNLFRVLTDAGIRPSIQRVTVLEYLYSCESHPTADEIYAALVSRHPMLSRTTIFNCLKLFAEKGLVNDIDISSDSTRYDYSGRPPHAHFMCRACHRIFDIPYDVSSIRAPSDFVCDNINVFFKGICPDCSGRINQ